MQKYKVRRPKRSSSSGSGFNFRSSTRSSSGGTSHRYGNTVTYHGRGGGCGCGGFFLFLIIVIIIIVIASQGKKGKSKSSGDYISADEALDESKLKPIDRKKVEEQIAKLKEKDPNFSEKVFLDKAQTAFFAIQRAWSKNDLEPARKYMSEAQFNRMNMQLEEIKEKGWRNILSDIVIGKAEIAEVGSEGEYDYIKVRIHASMADKTVDANGNVVEGGDEIKPFVESWTFIRKQGAKTTSDGGRTVAHNCPNCGAPIEAGESGKCPYCDATITAASFDWVLDTITHGYEEMEEDSGLDDFDDESDFGGDFEE